MSKIKNTYKKIYTFSENNYYITCIKRGLSLLLPVLVLGIIAYIFRYFPLDPYQDFMTYTLNGTIGRAIQTFYNISIGYFSLWSLITVSYFVIKGKTNEFPVILMSVITSVLCLFILTDVNNFMYYDFGLKNIFISLVIGCLVPTIIFKLMQKPKEFDPIYAKTNQRIYRDMIKLSFPIILIVGSSFLIGILVFGVLKCESINDLIGLPFVKLINLFDIEILKGFLYQFFSQILWMFGIDGNDALSRTVFNGPVINTNFMPIFVLSTTVIGFLIATIVFSKQKRNKIYAEFGAVPSLFNMNKVVYVGYPIILAPILFIPFVVSALLSFLIAYIATYYNMIPAATIDVYDSLPVFLNGYFSTKSSLAMLVQFACVAVSFLCYIPFILLHNKVADETFKENIKTLYWKFEEAKNKDNRTTIYTFNYYLSEIAKTMTIRLLEDMRHGKIETFFQPIVNNKKAYVGMECLMRWIYEDNIVPPPLALEIAKESGLFYDLNYYIWDKMCQNVSKAHTKAFITFNVSVDCLEKEEFEEKLLGIFEKYNLEPNGFVIEITEETVLNHQFEVLEKITRLRKKGFQFAIDDFGAGQTSMKYFQTNAFELVKIDGDLVKNAEKNPQNYDIIKSMKDLGKKGNRFENINFRVLCEFVETEEQFEKLNSLSIDYYQGYLFGKAMPYEEVIKLVNVRKQQNV